MLPSLALCTLTALTGVAPRPAGAAVLSEVRVRLKRSLTSVAIEGLGVRVTPPTRFLTVAVPPMGPARAVIRAPERGRWVVEYDNRPSEEIVSERLWVKGRMMRLGRDAAPFDLELYQRPSGVIDVIAHLDVDSYLTGVLPAEMPLTWPLEALKAQAVAARSFAWTLARERRSWHYDVDSTITDQVYRFADVTRAAGAHASWATKLERAVRETRGEVLTDARGHVMKAYYSADCGCVTEDPRYVWGHQEGFESVRDPTCAKRRPRPWHHHLARAEVVKRLSKGLKLEPGTTLESLLVGGLTPSGRVANVVALVKTPAGRTRRVLTVTEFRRVFGFRQIQSSEFSLAWMGEELKISGVGRGHGVGMCQTGARAMAEGGSTYRAILKQYYPQAAIGRRLSI